MRKNAGYIPGSLNIKNKGSIAGLKHNIQIYSKELEHQKDITQEAQKTLNLLQKHDPENWRRKHVKDVIENPEAVNALRKLYATNKISSSQYRDFYDTFGKWTDQKTIEGTGPGAVYSGKKAQEEWGKSEHWKDFTDKVNTAATAIPLIGAGAALGVGNLIRPILANPYVSGAMNAYGLYNLPHGISQTYNDFSRGNIGTGVFNGLMTAVDTLPVIGGARYIKNLVPGVRNVVKGNADFKDLFKPADLMTVRAPEINNKVLEQKISSPTLGRYYGDINDSEQLKYWPQKNATDAQGKVIVDADGNPIKVDEATAFLNTKLGGTKASVAHLRMDNLKTTGKWARRTTNPDGTTMSRNEIGNILSDIDAEKASLVAERKLINQQLKAGNKSLELKGRLAQINAKEKSLHNLLDDASFTLGPQRSIPRPDEFDSKLKQLITKGINNKPVNLTDSEIETLRFITNNHNDYWNNPAVKEALEKSPQLQDILQSREFSSGHEYVLPRSKKLEELTKPNLLNLLGSHNNRAFINNYYRNNPNSKNSPFGLLTEANLLRNELLTKPAIGAANIAYHALPYTNQETIPYFGGPEEEHKEQGPISISPISEERDVTNEVLPNPWAASKQNIFGLKAGGPMYLNNNKKFPTFTNR